MKKNESQRDRSIRFILAIVFTMFAFLYLQGIWHLLAVIVALILLVTALNGFCLVYKFLGISTVDTSVKTDKS